MAVGVADELQSTEEKKRSSRANHDNSAPGLCLGAGFLGGHLKIFAYLFNPQS